MYWRSQCNFLSKKANLATDHGHPYCPAGMTSCSMSGMSQGSPAPNDMQQLLLLILAARENKGKGAECSLSVSLGHDGP
ncbi:hypothetical protein VFPPC_16222 [Pochonia chlamydosporia 170]|uniref:Uncharacterized protein n=1 Tax=Pochonia chlamydosporia 170 TaxID=1380566 RepID=A0A179FG41_METCM|nr:hypothetical protein VFPPC_16222 [Pochonia chlamydosporia 170]OAQ64504.1 hypothetical protein VFPPC_16222 [Pochonia chlamydosporia 170]